MMKGKRLLLVVFAIIAVLSLSTAVGCFSGEKACEHQWNAATCTAPKTCKLCGATEGTTLQHDWNAATCTAPKTCKVCGATEGTTLQHDWNAATCTAPKTCKLCGETEGEALEHELQLEDRIPATCTTNGVEVYKCKNCDYETEQITDYATGHNPSLISWGETAEKSVDGCKHTYEKEGTCLMCGETVKEEYTVEIHTYTVAITTPATCMIKGVKTLTCSCGATSTEEYEDANAHVWGTAVNDGTYDVYTCTCSGCTATKKVLNHKEDVNATVSATALANSELELKNAKVALDSDTLNALGDDVTISAETADANTLQISNELKAQIGDKPVYDFSLESDGGAVSSFDGYITIKVPYELKSGEDPDAVAIWYINNDGEVETIEGKYSNGEVEFKTNHFSYYTVTKLTPAERCDLYGHIYKEDKVDATCVSSGYTLKICTRCGDYEKVDIPALGHDFVETDRGDATCVKNGKITYKCANCDLENVKVLVATGHDFELEDEKAPTCTEEGYYKYVCAGCGEEKTETIKMVSHKFVKEVVAPTEAGDGYTLHTCSVCGYEYKDNYIKFEDKDDPTKTAILTTILTNGIEGVNSFTISNLELKVKEENIDIKVNEAKFSLDIADDLIINGYVVFDVDMTYGLSIESKLFATENGNVKGQAIIENDVIYVFANAKAPSTSYDYGSDRESKGLYLNEEIDYVTIDLNQLYISEEIPFGSTYSELKEMLVGLIETNKETVKSVADKISEVSGNLGYEVSEKLLELFFNLEKTTEGYEVKCDAEKLLELNDYLKETTVIEIIEKYAGEGLYASIPDKIDDILDITIGDILGALDKAGINVELAEKIMTDNGIPAEMLPMSIDEIKAMLDSEEFTSMSIKDIICMSAGIEEDNFVAIYNEVLEMVNTYLDMFGNKSIYQIVEGFMFGGVAETEEGEVEEPTGEMIAEMVKTVIEQFAKDFSLTITANDDKEVLSVSIAYALEDVVDVNVTISLGSEYDVAKDVKAIKDFMAKFEDSKIIQAVLDKYSDYVTYDAQRKTLKTFEIDYSWDSNNNSFSVPVTVGDETFDVVVTYQNKQFITYYADKVMKAAIKGCGNYYDLSCNIFTETNDLYAPIGLSAEELLSVIDLEDLSEYGVIGFDQETGCFIMEGKLGYKSKNFGYDVSDGTVVVEDHYEVTRHDYTVEVVKEPQGCMDIGERKYTCKNCGYSYTEKFVNGHGNYYHTFTLQGDTCEDGVTVNKYCGYCNKFVGSEEVYDHDVFRVKTIDVSDEEGNYGIRVYACACGEHLDYSTYGGYDYDYDDEGNRIYEFYNGKVIAVKETEAPVPNETCKIRLTYEFLKDYNESTGTYSGRVLYTGIMAIHDYTCYVKLADGAEDCYDGVIVTYVCSKCGKTRGGKSGEYLEHYHVNGILEEYDLRDYGCKDETYLRITGCPCGYYGIDFNVQVDCSFDSRTIYYNGEYDKLYVYGCCITDPLCGFKYAVKTYQKPNDCAVYRDFIVNCNDQGENGTVIKTVVIDYAHDFDYQYEKDELEPCKYYVTRTCKNCSLMEDCGETYQHTFESGVISEETEGCYTYYYNVCDVCGEKSYYYSEPNHNYETLSERSCTQWGIAVCTECGYESTNPPYEHSFIWDDEKECYVCDDCGLESAVRYNGEIILEELSSEDEDEIRIGYNIGMFWYDEQDYTKKYYVAVSLVSKDDSEEEPIVLNDVAVYDDEDDYMSYVSVYKSEIEEVSEEQGVSLDDYLIRINFVPFGGLGDNLEYAITIE